MESDAVESDHSDEDSEMSFGSSHSSCETSTAVSPVPLFIDPSNVEELQTYLRTKQQSMIQKLQVKSGFIFFREVPHSFDDAQLTKFFSRYGRILRVRVFLNLQYRGAVSTGMQRSAWMEFGDVCDAQLAVQSVTESPVYSKLFHCALFERSRVPLDAFDAAARPQRLSELNIRPRSISTLRRESSGHNDAFQQRHASTPGKAHPLQRDRSKTIGSSPANPTGERKRKHKGSRHHSSGSRHRKRTRRFAT